MPNFKKKSKKAKSGDELDDWGKHVASRVAELRERAMCVQRNPLSTEERARLLNEIIDRCLFWSLELSLHGDTKGSVTSTTMVRDSLANLANLTGERATSQKVAEIVINLPDAIETSKGN